jgi:hypothetical protein
MGSDYLPLYKKPSNIEHLETVTVLFSTPLQFHGLIIWEGISWVIHLFHMVTVEVILWCLQVDGVAWTVQAICAHISSAFDG